MTSTAVVTVKLSKAWGPHTAGAEVEVDESRARWLDEHGYVKPSVVKAKVEKASQPARLHEKPKGNKRH